MSKIKKGDRVYVITGKDRKSDGKVLFVDKKTNRVIVEGVNIVQKHKKPSRQHQAGGIIKTEAPIHVSNVMYLHKGKPTRLGIKEEIITKKGKEVKVRKRIAKSTGEVID